MPHSSPYFHGEAGRGARSVTFTGMVKRLLAACGIVVHRRRHVPFGHDALFDIARLMTTVSIVIDVGANEGQSALPFAQACVFAFEPVPETFSILRDRTESEKRIRCFNLALGAQEGDVTIRRTDSSGHNSLLHPAEPGEEAVTV